MNDHSNERKAEAAPSLTKSGAAPAGAVEARMAVIFQVLSDPARLSVVLALERGERCVGDLAAASGLSQSLVSHHLRVLRERNLVAFRRQGKQTYYALADAHVFALLAVARDHALETLRPINPALRDN